MFTIVLICIMSYYATKILHAINPVVLLATAVIIPRLIWIIAIDTKPVSDFALYYDYALRMSSGDFGITDKTCLIFPQRVGFPFLLSMIMRVFDIKDVISLKIVNAIIAFLLSLLIYGIGKEVFDKKAGRAAGIIFALWPSQIMFTSVIASENYFMLFFTLSILAYMYYIKSGVLSKRIAFIAISAISAAVAQFIRPIAIMLIPIIFIYDLSSRMEINKKNIFEAVKNIVLLYISYLIFFGILCFITYQFTGINVFRSSAGYNLYVGVNYKSNGVYNKDDEKILSEFNWNFDEVHKEAVKRAVGRVISDPVGFVKLTGRKFIIFWGDDTYGINWSLAELNSSNRISDLFLNNKSYLIALVQVYYASIIFFMLIGCVCIIKHKDHKSIFIALLFLLHIAAYLLLEIQSRYRYPAMTLSMIFASYGIINMSSFINMITHGRIQSRGKSLS